MVRVHAEEALAEKDRRGAGAAETPVGRDARSIAQAQLRQIAEVNGGVIEPLVLDMPALQECSEGPAETIRTFAEEILQQRRLRETHEKVFFRRDDIDTLSHLLQCPPDAVTPLLNRMGLLA